MDQHNGNLRLAIVGVGARSSIALHAPAAHRSVELAAAVDTTQTGRERAANLFPGVSVFSSVDELISSGTADAAVVCTPDHTHADVAVSLLRAGIAVYLEKPLATSVEDADRVLEVAAATGVPLYVGHNFRHSGVARTMKDVIDRGDIGEVKAIWVRHFVGNGGDYYFKDWHADRSKTHSLLLQKASHDIDIIHYLAGSYTRRVVGMGELMVYGDIDDRRDRSGETMPDWFSFDNWPPAAQAGLNPVVDVEDVSMMLMTLESGVLASYEQCHFTPDYWRNYTVIGTEGRLENIGDTAGGTVKVWNKRREWSLAGDVEYPIDGVTTGHEDADSATMQEFLRYVIDGTPTVVTPLAARAAVAAGALAADSMRSGSQPFVVPDLPGAVVQHFRAMQRAGTLA